jgi:type 1 fimbria pilin
MKHRRVATRRNLLCALAVCAIWPSGEAVAAPGGCDWRNTATYTIAVTANTPVWNGMPPAHVPREGYASGDGVTLLECYPGDATFKSEYRAPTEGGLVPLTVRGVRSGFGIRIYIRELKEDRIHDIPSTYQRTFTEQCVPDWFPSSTCNPVTSSDAEVGYQIVRMAGNVEFGTVDPKDIAIQYADPRGGTPTLAFRHVKVTSLAFVRPACSIEAADLNQTVTLGPYNASNFATPERATPWVKFRLTTKACEASKGITARFTFGMMGEAIGGEPTLYPLDGPEHVGLELSDKDQKSMEVGKPVSFDALGTGEAYMFHARLRETGGTVRGGDFRRGVQVLVDFM